MGVVVRSGVCPRSSLRLMGWAGPPISCPVLGYWDCRLVSGIVVYESPVSAWLSSTGGPGGSRCHPKVGCMVSGEGNDPVIPGEGLTEYGVASRQGRAGFPVYARQCVADDDVVGV